MQKNKYIYGLINLYIATSMILISGCENSASKNIILKPQNFRTCEIAVELNKSEIQTALKIINEIVCEYGMKIQNPPNNKRIRTYHYKNKTRGGTAVFCHISIE